MSEQVQATRRPQQNDHGSSPSTTDAGAEQRQHAEKIKAETDALLDDIDALLEDQGLSGEEEAQKWVASYVQKAGE